MYAQHKRNSHNTTPLFSSTQGTTSKTENLLSCKIQTIENAYASFQIPWDLQLRHVIS